MFANRRPQDEHLYKSELAALGKLSNMKHLFLLPILLFISLHTFACPDLSGEFQLENNNEPFTVTQVGCEAVIYEGTHTFTPQPEKWKAIYPTDGKNYDSSNEILTPANAQTPFFYHSFFDGDRFVTQSFWGSEEQCHGVYDLSVRGCIKLESATFFDKALNSFVIHRIGVIFETDGTTKNFEETVKLRRLH